MLKVHYGTGRGGGGGGGGGANIPNMSACTSTSES